MTGPASCWLALHLPITPSHHSHVFLCKMHDPQGLKKGMLQSCASSCSDKRANACMNVHSTCAHRTNNLHKRTADHQRSSLQG